MHRKAQVNWLFIPIALALMAFSLFSFVSFNGKFTEGSEGRDEMLTKIDFFERYAIRESSIIVKEVVLSGGLIMTDAGLKSRFQEIAEKKNLGIKEAQGYFEKIKAGEFVFKHEGKEYLLEIKDLSFKAESGVNSFSRNSSFQIKLDFSGNALTIAKDL